MLSQNLFWELRETTEVFSVDSGSPMRD